MPDSLSELWTVLDHYQARLAQQLQERWSRLPVDYPRRQLGEVVGALLARQTSLGIQIARAPSTWNGHIAPVFLRVMVDLLITLKWILKDPEARAKTFVLYGVGQAKLELEHRIVQLTEDGVDPEEDPLVKARKAWIDSQRMHFLVEVDVGSWSGLSVRDMAVDADCLHLLNYSYAPFSASVHSMWHHVARYNLIPCKSELHRPHQLPWVGPDSTDLDYLYVSAKYVERAFQFVEDAFGLAAPAETVFDWLEKEIDRVGHAIEETNAASSESA